MDITLTEECHRGNLGYVRIHVLSLQLTHFQAAIENDRHEIVQWYWDLIRDIDLRTVVTSYKLWELNPGRDTTIIEGIARPLLYLTLARSTIYTQCRLWTRDPTGRVTGLNGFCCHAPARWEMFQFLYPSQRTKRPDAEFWQNLYQIYLSRHDPDSRRIAQFILDQVPGVQQLIEEMGLTDSDTDEEGAHLNDILIETPPPPKSTLTSWAMDWFRYLSPH